MQQQEPNLYRVARDQVNGMTQERWAAMLGVSVQAVRAYEAGTMMPADDIVLSMADLSGMPVLGLWHLRRKSAVAAEMLPPVERLPLAQAVVQLLAQIRIFEEKHHADALLLIASDGIVDEDEMPRFKEVVSDLFPLVKAALQIDYAIKD